MKNTDFLINTRYAHRGLHDNKTIPENSLIAFQNAIDHGYGIEFDVYLTDDNNLIIHHDFPLKRTCGLDINAFKVDVSKLDSYKLFGTNHSIPLLKDMLNLVHGQVPLILEIKPTNKIEKTCAQIYNMIADYEGDIAIESFDKRIVDWWCTNHNEFVIGQLFSDFALERNCLKFNKQYQKVDFLAVSCKRAKDKYFARVKAKDPLLLIINWVVRTEKDLLNAKQYADNFIFECNIKDDKYVSLEQINEK